jgi:hypothetical protein
MTDFDILHCFADEGIEAEAQSDDHVEATRLAVEGAEDKADTPSSK